MTGKNKSYYLIKIKELLLFVVCAMIGISFRYIQNSLCIVSYHINVVSTPGLGACLVCEQFS